MTRVTGQIVEPFGVIGIDPGITTGWAMGIFDGKAWSWSLAQTTGHLTTAMMNDLDRSDEIRAVFVEDFVIGSISLRSKESKAVIELIGQLEQAVGSKLARRSAAAVKPWATNKRLGAVGVDVRGMRHAADAARHALYGSVWSGWAPDPLSFGPLSMGLSTKQ